MNGLQPKVSVVIPIYNVEKYLARCLESVINQTLYDIEIICVVDGSKDGSAEILEQYAAKDNRIIKIYKENGGLSSARNAGIKAASGEWIVFLDSDDFLSLNACERIWTESMQEYTEIITFGTEMFPVYPYPDSWHYWTLNVSTARYKEYSPWILFENPNSKPFVWRQAYLRKFLENSEVLFDESLEYGEDVVFQMEIFPHANNFSYISDKLYNYRWYRKGSLMTEAKKDSAYMLAEHSNMLVRIIEYWKQKGWINKKPDGVYLLTWILDFIVPDLLEEDLPKGTEYVRNLWNSIFGAGLLKYKGKLSMERKFLLRSLRKIL